MKIKFLADANFDQDIVLGVWRRQPLIEFYLPQHFIAERTDDPGVLAIAAQRGAVLVTHDVRTMPFHFAKFIGETPSPGLIIVPRKLTISVVIEELVMIWEASSRRSGWIGFGVFPSDREVGRRPRDSLRR